MPRVFPLLIAGRIASGFAAGLMSGTGTAAVLDLFPQPRKSVGGALAVGVNMGGLALGTLLAGVLADLAPTPLLSPFLVHLGLSLTAVAALLTFTPGADPARTGPFRFQKPGVPPAIRRPFVQAVLAGGAGWAVTSVLTATGGLFLAATLHLISHTLTGFVLFVAFGTTATGQLLAKRWTPNWALIVGCAGQILACGLLAAALWGGWLPPLIGAAIAVGIASGICLNAGVAMTAERVPSDQRGAVSSALFAGLYLMLSFPAIGVGLLASATDLRFAGLVFSALVALLAVGVGVSLLRRPGETGPVPA